MKPEAMEYDTRSKNFKGNRLDKSNPTFKNQNPVIHDPFISKKIPSDLLLDEMIIPDYFPFLFQVIKFSYAGP